MSRVIDSLEREQLRRMPAFQPGDRLKVHFQVIEGTRRRTQVFEGVVLKRQGSGARETFTVRKQSFGVGVERTFPLHSPKIERIEVASRGDVRRAKLYYLRGRVGRRARVRERQYTGAEVDLAREEQEMFDAQGPQAQAEPVAADVVAGEDEEGAAEDGSGETAEAEGAGAAEGAGEAEAPSGEAEDAGGAEGDAAAEGEGAPEEEHGEEQPAASEGS